MSLRSHRGGLISCWPAAWLASACAALGVLMTSCAPSLADRTSDSASDPAPHLQEDVSIARPEWATTVGIDQQGHWADVTVDGMTQRLRLILPGTVVMGSPVDETGRDIQEVPHPVTLTQGYWLADSPCTQSLWTAIMRSNPSYFTGDPQLPVEQVSAEEVASFLAGLNARVHGALFVLPTEAQWEYAARAGAADAYGHAALDAVGWFSANSGMRTHAVKTKEPNDWGLYDMHGNVWSICQDAYRPYASGAARDPVTHGAAAKRVIRGGSWSSDAAACRSASRGSIETTGKCGNAVGFRISVTAHGLMRVAQSTGRPGASAAKSGAEAVWPSLSGSDAHGDWTDLTIGSVTQRMRWIPPGSFTMGSPLTERGRDDNEVPHAVVIAHGFWLADSACTEALWHAVLHTPAAAEAGDLLRPQVKISWVEVQDFLAQLNRDLDGVCMLPSEAQREYACRARTTGPFAASALDAASWYRKTSGGRLHPVKMLEPNGWGLFDMEGNVGEWCEDWYGAYPTAEARDPSGADGGTERVIRGASWRSTRDACRSAYRDWLEPERANALVGFRICIQVRDP